MSLVKTRRIISALLSVILVVGFGMVTGALIVRSTLCSGAYMNMFFSGSKVTSYCDNAFNNKLEEYSNEYNIPKEVLDFAFSEIKENNDSSIIKLYEGYDPNLYTGDKVDTVEKYIKEYLDGNEIKYDSIWLNQITKNCVQAYADCYAINNVYEGKDFVDAFSVNYAKYSSAGLLIMATAMISYLLLYQKKNDIHLQILSSFTASGFTFILTGLSALILQLGTHPKISPEIYARAISNAVRGDFIILIVIGAVVTAFSIRCSILINKNK